MAIIVPAILEKEKSAFNEKAALAMKIPGVERIQVDFADNVFVPNQLLSAEQIDALNPAFIWEAHLMCDAPSDFLEYRICGFKKVIIHYEAYKNEQALKAAVEEIMSLQLEPSICVNLDTSVKVLQNFSDIKNFQFMAITPGFQGNPFHPEVLKRIQELRSLLPHAIIEVDGGVNETNIKQLKEAGADLIVAGSSVVKAKSPTEAYAKLLSLIR